MLLLTFTALKKYVRKYLVWKNQCKRQYILYKPQRILHAFQCCEFKHLKPDILQLAQAQAQGCVLVQLRQRIFSLPRAWPCGASHSRCAAPWRRHSPPAAVRPAGTGCRTQCTGPGWGRYPLAGGLSLLDTKWPGMREYTCLWEQTGRCQALECLTTESDFGRQFEKRCSF